MEKNRIHLNNKEHAILEHFCNIVGTLAKSTLIIMLVLDAEYVKKATAHWAAVKVEHEDKELVYFAVSRSIFLILYVLQYHFKPMTEPPPSLLVTCMAASLNAHIMSLWLSTCSWPYPRPHPIFGESKGNVWKIIDMVSSNPISDSQAFEGNKLTWSSKVALILVLLWHLRHTFAKPSKLNVHQRWFSTLTSHL